MTQAAEGDRACRRVLADAGRAIGRALANVCNVINPQRIVIGGDLTGADSSLVDGVDESLRRYALPTSSADLEVRPGQLKERAEVLGAVRLVISDTQVHAPQPLAMAS